MSGEVGGETEESGVLEAKYHISRRRLTNAANKSIFLLWLNKISFAFECNPEISKWDSS